MNVSLTGAAATLSARLPGLAADLAFPLFRDLAERLDLPCEATGTGVALALPSGRIALAEAADGLTVTLSTDSPARLYTLREIVHARLDRLERPVEVLWERVDEGALPPNLVTARLVSVTQVSPGFRRVRVAGEGLARFGGAGLHFRLMLPPLGRAAVWPRIGAAGRTVWPAGEDALHRPVYTTRALGPQGEWLDFDVFLHEGGRVTRWTEEAAPGAALGLMGPTGRETPEAGWVALFADETALPAVARILAALPATARGHAFVELADPADRQPLDCPEGVSLRWLTRGGRCTLLSKLEALEVPAADRFVWFAAEKSQADAARAALRAGHGLSRGEMSVTAYWSLPESREN